MTEIDWATPATPREYAYLSAEGAADPETITQALGIEPDRIYSLGDPIPNKRGATLYRRRSHWRLNSRLDDTEPMERHVNALLRRIVPKRQELLQLQQDFAFSIVCVSLGDNFSFTTDMEMQRLATSCAITFWFDIYPGSETHEIHTELREQLDAALAKLSD